MDVDYMPDERMLEDLEEKINLLNELIQPPKGEIVDSRTVLKRKPVSSKKSSPVAKAVTIYDSYDCDEKIRDKIRHTVSKMMESRPYLSETRGLTPDQIYRWTLEFLNGRGYWNMDSIKDKQLIAIYSVLMTCRLHGIFLDHHMLANEMGVSSKLLQKCIFKCSPPVTSTNELDRQIVKLALECNKFELREEYSNCLRRIIPGIPDEGVREFEGTCKNYLETINLEGICDDEKQFCVSADKIFIYGIFETCRKFSPDKTERSLCEKLSEYFSIPRVSIEKMKRLVHKSFNKQNN